MFCTKCGFYMQEGDNFCTACGCRVETVSENGVFSDVGGNGGYAPPPPNDNNKSSNSKTSNAVRTLITVLLAISIFFVGFLNSFLCFTRTFIGYMVTDSYTSIGGWTLDNMGYYVSEEYARDIQEILEDEECMKKIMAQYANYFVGGEEPKGLTDDEIEDIIDEIEDEDIRLDGNLEDAIYNMLSEEGLEDYTDGLKGSSSWVLIETIRGIMSFNNVIILSVLSIILILLLFIVRKSFGGSLKAVGIPVAIMSVPYFLIRIVGTYMCKIMFSSGQGGYEIKRIMEFYLNKGLIYGVVFLIVGVIMIIVGNALSKRKKTCYNK